MRVPVYRAFSALVLWLCPLFAQAQESAAVADTGDTAWLITATALVLFMTIPGLALFYAGMVRAKNVLSVMMQCFAITALVTVLWVAYGYSLAFDASGMAAGDHGLASFVGSFGKAFLAGVPRDAL